MEGGEVTLSDVMVKEEVEEVEVEEEEDSHKTQVILHLCPVVQGGNGDMNTMVQAIEAHRGSDDSQVQGEEVEYGYPITCGDSRAVLLFKKFVCPGINFHQQLISPKQFVHLAGKASLKDWKRAIRLGGVMLRKMMDSGQIDFYQHDTVCTNNCRSTKSDVLVNGTRVQDTAGSPVHPSRTPLHPSPGLQDSPGCPVPPSRTPGQPSSATGASQGPGGQPLQGDLRVEIVNDLDSAPEQKVTTTFELSSVADSGLMGDVLVSIQNQLDTALTGLDLRMRDARLQARDAMMLHSLCELLGLLDSVEKVLEQRHSEMDHLDPEDHLTHRTLCGSDLTTGDQRKCVGPTRPSRARTHRTTAAPRRSIQSLLDPGGPPPGLVRPPAPQPLPHRVSGGRGLEGGWPRRGEGGTVGRGHTGNHRGQEVEQQGPAGVRKHTVSTPGVCRREEGE
ncbi:hypothetical protein CRUP_021716, partial [Coryphaenoides rupestris]